MIKKFIVIFIAATFFLSGCTSDKSDLYEKIEHTEISTSEKETYNDLKDVSPVNGGTLNLTMRQPKTLNPLINNDITVDSILHLVFETLFVLDENQKPTPNLVDNYNFSEDGLTLTINIKNNMYWQDGTSISAEDVIFSLDTIRNSPEGSLYKNVLRNISSYSSSGSTVNITYSSKYSGCLYNLCFPIIPRHYYKDKNSFDSDINLNPLGNGMYKFNSYQLARKMTLEKSNNFKGTPYIDKIEVTITSDKETDLYSFEQSLTDAVDTDIMEWGKYSGNKKIDISEYYTNEFEFLGYNFNSHVFANLNVRKALAYAIPFDDIVGNIYLGHAVKSITPINPTSWLSSSDELGNYEHDLNKAREYLKASEFSGDKLTVSILVNSGNSERLETASVIKNNLELIGMTINVVSKPFDEYKKDIESGNYEMFLGGINLENNMDFSSMFLSTAKAPNGLNYFNYSIDKMNDIINRVFYSDMGTDNYKVLMKEAEQYIISELPCIGICFKTSALLTGQHIRGEKKPVINNIYSNIEKWYISE